MGTEDNSIDGHADGFRSWREPQYSTHRSVAFQMRDVNDSVRMRHELSDLRTCPLRRNGAAALLRSACPVKAFNSTKV